MGQVQNGHVHITVKEQLPEKQSRGVQKAYRLYAALCYSNAKSTLLVLLTFIKFEKAKCEFFNFVHLLLLLFHHA